MCGTTDLRMFSEKVTEGASRVPDAVLMITDRSAPKKITCIANGIFSKINIGKINCESLLMYLATKSGSIIVAE